MTSEPLKTEHEDPSGYYKLENCVYTITEKDKGASFLFIPAYFTFVLKSVSSLDLKQGSVEISGTLVMRFLFQNVPNSVKKDISTLVEIRLNEEPIRIEAIGEGVNYKETKSPVPLGVYTYRFTRTIKFQPNLKEIPFDWMDICFTIELTSRNVEGIKYRFNLHECVTSTANVNFKKDCDRLAQYSLICPIPPKKSSELVSELKKEQKPWEDKNNKKAENRRSILPMPQNKEKKPLTKNKVGNLRYEYYPVILYRIGIYRHPFHLIITTILPLFILQLMLLCVYIQWGDTSGKIGNVATLMLAIIAFIPSIRAEMPALSTAVFTDYLIYTAIGQAMLGMLEAVITQASPDLEHVTLIFFIISCFFPGTLVVILAFKSLKYLRNRHIWDRPLSSAKVEGGAFDINQWKNENVVCIKDEKKYEVDLLYSPTATPLG